MPFSVTKQDGVLTLTLDTPGSPINIFNHATAHQLIDILSTVTPATTRAIVFETAKAHSFINGVGLLLAHASQSYADIARASTPPWTAYRAVREAQVPTIAVIQGSCFGCGVEFALNCDYRIASDRGETKFYMTELNDYLFIPLFGGTWNLPAAVGLSDAVELLLWGARWNAPKAYERGLVDAVAPYEDLPRHTRDFIAGVLDGVQPSRRRERVPWSVHEDRVIDAARRRIAVLPPQYQTVYGDALDLLQAGARQTHTYIEHQQLELQRSAASALSPIGKAAYAFFYLRQMANERAAGRARGAATPLTLSLDTDGSEDANAFARDLAARRLPGVAFHGGDAEFHLVAARRATSQSAPNDGGREVSTHAAFGSPNGRGHDVAVQLSLAGWPEPGMALYAPLYRSGGRLIELATPAGAEPACHEHEVARFTRTLQRFGFEVARTTPVNTFLSNRLLIAYLMPLLKFVELYDDAGVLNEALRHAGFVRRPHDLVAALDRRRVAVELAASASRSAAELDPLLNALDCPHRSDGRNDGIVLDALCISWLDASLSARLRGDVRDACIVDLIAREILDFPRHLCSLCTWLK